MLALIVDIRGLIADQYASLTSQGEQHRVFLPDGHLSNYQLHPMELNFSEQKETCVSLGASCTYLILGNPILDTSSPCYC